MPRRRSAFCPSANWSMNRDYGFHRIGHQFRVSQPVSGRDWNWMVVEGLLSIDGIWGNKEATACNCYSNVRLQFNAELVGSTGFNGFSVWKRSPASSLEWVRVTSPLVQSGANDIPLNIGKEVHNFLFEFKFARGLNNGYRFARVQVLGDRYADWAWVLDSCTAWQPDLDACKESRTCIYRHVCQSTDGQHTIETVRRLLLGLPLPCTRTHPRKCVYNLDV